MAEDNKGIFISYRRKTNAAHAGWLGDTLSEHFGEHKVFRDIDSIEPGLDFVETIKLALDSSEVLIAMIGDSWLDVTDAKGRPHLQDPDDYVRLEIGTALKRNVRVIPVLVQGATMPQADELPDDLAPLARRNAFELRDTRWRDDVRSLITALERVVETRNEGEDTRTEQPPPPVASNKQPSLLRRIFLLYPPPTTLSWVWQTLFFITLIILVALTLASFSSPYDSKGENILGVLLAVWIIIFGPLLLIFHRLARRVAVRSETPDGSP